MGIDQKQVEALLKKPGVTPDELVTMMRDLTAPVIPFLSRQQDLMDEDDVQIDRYQKWVDSWRNAGSRDAEQYNDIVEVGKSLLIKIAENHLGLKLMVTGTGPGGSVATTGDAAESLSIDAQVRAKHENEALKETLKDAGERAKKFVGDATSGLKDIIIILGLGYFLIEALKDTAQKSVMRRT